MPTPPTPALTTNPRKMPRLRRAGNTIKILASIFVFAFLCAYAHTYLRYGNGAPRTPTTASIAHPTTIARTRPAPTFRTSTFHPRAFRRHQPSFRPVHQLNRHQRRSTPFYLASLRHIRRLFSQLLVVRS